MCNTRSCNHNMFYVGNVARSRSPAAKVGQHLLLFLKSKESGHSADPDSNSCSKTIFFFKAVGIIHPVRWIRKWVFPWQALPFSYVKEARAKTGSASLCPFSYFWWVLYSSGSGFLCPFFGEVFAEGSPRSVTPWLKNRGIFWWGVRRRQPPERHSLV